ncbi:MAG: V-type ATP synthase subunit D [Ruminococcus sp.]|uniref:V-type ATP synthase subunit D n=1 Tax=Ruminococcus sp. TaxID=41978 RepID=UPI0025D567C3|nr:V-type ATP synthase subunit D [Ruminococcus sp.]MBQ3886023.1 V-type ATP synthase subunit D [Ruminococcus sp.]MBQ3947160.1 V-type ATP synthase subunit D [Ruminococcus sp.]MBR6394107.1 V-type ATP synthase subunit D [Ruminococcus sp.]MCR4796278.1 V-type ATP synthase subunit D [Ruminococcus sp.]
MARLNVNPTRMELSKLKKKLSSARRGHKLLKDKRDELMRQFMILIKEDRQLRAEVEAALSEANRYMAVAGSVMQREVLETALMLPKQEVELEISEKNVMSVSIPVFDAKFKTDDSSDIFSYGTAFTSIDLDGAVMALSDVFPKMIRLAEIEKACQLMADEIEKTRRRVNALEHIMIPDYEETIKFITMKLSENERSTTTSLMKVKDMVLKQSHNYH